MTATLTVAYRDPERTVSEHYADVCAAGEAIAAIAEQMDAEITPGPVTAGRNGHLTVDRDIDAPIRISQVVAFYEITED